MKNRFAAVLVFACLFLTFGSAQADEARAVSKLVANAAATPNCPMKADTTINVSFNSTQKDVAVVKALVDTKTADIQALAKEVGITSIEMQSMNYSINANRNNSGGCSESEDMSAPANMNYQVYGNLNFKIQPAEKATEFLALLVKKGFNANLSVNTYKQCQ